MSSDKAFTNQTMMTCIGNKRKFLNNIESIINDIKKKENKHKLNIFDAFSGSGIVARMLSYHSNNLFVNDLEYYSNIINNCYLKTPSKNDQLKINNLINDINKYIGEESNLIEGIITNNYAPKDSNNIKLGERCFYTRENALIIDTIRHYIETKVEDKFKIYLLGNLLVKASIHNNTGGVFKGFYKSKTTKKGCWGGDGENALTRIKGLIRLESIIWNNENTFNLKVYNDDTNKVIDLIDNLDIIYIDPPYNQHPYGSNYFMLNTIANNNLGEHISAVSGIPYNWNKSNYNYKKTAVISMIELLEKSFLKAKYIMLSYNNEGIITKDDWKKIFEPYNIKKYEFIYDTYKASRNLNKRNNKVIEHIYLISKK
tara:strand:+ start:1537 stop:2649 length:1113 start_codon:yes stop_codon:yes gene_type:complete